jgi:hypothetical protein
MPYTPEAPLADRVDQFFQTYARDSESGDTSALVAHFADTFLAAGPHGAQPTRVADFALMLPKRKQLFDALGCHTTTLVSVQQIPLDARYVLARTCWRLAFSRPQPLAIDVNSDFLIDTGGDECKILLYLANQDLMAALRDRGIALPAPPTPA